MKIVYLSNAVIPSRTANSIHVMKMCQAFSKNGFSTTLFAKNPQKKSLHEIFGFYGIKTNFNFHFYKTPVLKGSSVFSLFNLYIALKALSPTDTLVYARDIYGVVLAILMGFKVIYESHGIPSLWHIILLEKFILKHRGLIKLVVISKALKNLYSKMEIKDLLIEVHHDGSDIPENTTSGCYEWPGRDNRLQIGYIGHLYKGRGIDIVLKCSQFLKNMDFHIIGGEERDIIMWKRNKLPNVVFHGFVSPKFTSYLRSKCDILLMPYQKELAIAGKSVNTSSWMSPLKMFEYMSSKKAIISSDLPVIKEVLNTNNAILVKPDDERMWVQALEKLGSDISLRDRLALQAYEDFITKYTWTIRAKNLVKNVIL